MSFSEMGKMKRVEYKNQQNWRTSDMKVLRLAKWCSEDEGI